MSGRNLQPAALYLCALAIGIAWTLLLMPIETIAGGGPLWAAPNGDNAQALAGNLAYQLDAWRFPILYTHDLFWPGGFSVAMSDSNSLFALIGKVIASFTGHPVNLLGVWWAVCWTLQPVAGVFALRCLGVRGFVPGLAAAALAALTPAMLNRIYHINLCGHFTLLATLGATFLLLRQETTRRWVLAGVFLFVAILCHPYLFAFAAGTLTAVPFQRLFGPRGSRWRLFRVTGLRFLAASFVPFAVFGAMSGSYGGGDHGFAIYSMNVLSPFWPQRSGIFGHQLPIINATIGQYEGFNYQGVGTLLLILAALVTFSRERLRPWRGLAVTLAGLTLLALSSRIYVGNFRILNLGLKPWEDIFAPIRASGRAFWPVGYALMLAGVAAAARLPRVIGWPLMALAVGLQWVDTTSLRYEVEAAMVLGVPTPPVADLPAGGTLLTMLPAPGCGPNTREANLVLLRGVRAGMKLGDIGVGRPPRWFNCEKMITNAAERPLLPGELRAFAAEAVPDVREELLGPGASCARSAALVICGTPQAPPLGQVVALRHLIPELGPDLPPLLSYGWKRDATGLAWSEGPRSTLAFQPPPGTGHIAFTLNGIASTAGSTRWMTVSDDTGVILETELPDETPTTLTVPTPASGPAWYAFDVFRAVNPKLRNLPAAPSDRVALQLLAVKPLP